MREIKFRAWDKYGDSMVIDWYYSDWSINEYFSKSEFIVMQYTGLKDKSGTEIYEGDVIQYKGMFVIEWDQYFCRFHRKSLTIKSNGIYQVFPLCEIEEKEVIGNIHSNPELLK